VSDRTTDPLSLAMACVRRLSDDGLDHLARHIAEEREGRYKHRLETARWRGTRLFSRSGKLTGAICLVWPPNGGSLSGFSGYWPTRCGGNGYGVHPEPSKITCKACLAAGAEDAIRGQA
jgi:hypothetical protein